MKLGYLLSLSAIAVLAACGSSASNNPNVIRTKFSEDKITGKYDSATFSAEQVKSAHSNLCIDGKVAGYGEQAGSDGTTSFTITCVDGPTFTVGGSTTTLKADGEMVTEALGSAAGGDLAYQKVPATK